MVRRRYRSAAGRLVAMTTTGAQPDPQIIEVLRDLGGTDEEIAAAVAAQRPAALAVDLVLTRDFTLPLDEVAARFDLPPDIIIEIYRLLGLAIDREGPVLCADDVALLEALAVTTSRRLDDNSSSYLSEDAGENLLRVIGTSVSRVADAAVSTFIPDVESQLQSSAADVVAWVRAEVQIGEVAHKVAPGRGTLFIHHLLDAIRRQRLTQEGVRERSMARI